jgi:hypothetical protein
MLQGSATVVLAFLMGSLEISQDSPHTGVDGFRFPSRRPVLLSEGARGGNVLGQCLLMSAMGQYLLMTGAGTSIGVP